MLTEMRMYSVKILTGNYWAGYLRHNFCLFPGKIFLHPLFIHVLENGEWMGIRGEGRL